MKRQELLKILSRMGAVFVRHGRIFTKYTKKTLSVLPALLAGAVLALLCAACSPTPTSKLGTTITYTVKYEVTGTLEQAASIMYKNESDNYDNIAAVPNLQ